MYLIKFFKNSRFDDYWSFRSECLQLTAAGEIHGISDCVAAIYTESDQHIRGRVHDNSLWIYNK